MKSEKRREERFVEPGKVNAKEICAISGILDDISQSGCKVHFSVPVTINLENDYVLSVLFSRRVPSFKMELLCHPQWYKVTDNITEIGFEILNSPTTPELNSYIQTLKAEASEKLEVESLLKDQDVVFVK